MHGKLHTVCNLKAKILIYILLRIIGIVIFPSLSKKNICKTANQRKQHTATEMRYLLPSEIPSQNAFHNPFP